MLECESKAFNDFVAKHNVNTIPGTRSIIVVDVHQVGSSCGYSVPFYEFKDFRKTLNQLWEKKEQEVKKGNKELTMDRYALNSDDLPSSMVRRSRLSSDLLLMPRTFPALGIGLTRVRGVWMGCPVCGRG